MVFDTGSDTYRLTWHLLVMVLTFYVTLSALLALVSQWPHDTEDIAAFKNSCFIYLKHKPNLFFLKIFIILPLYALKIRLGRRLPRFKLKTIKTLPCNTSKNFIGATESFNGNFQCIYMQDSAAHFTSTLMQASETGAN